MEPSKNQNQLERDFPEHADLIRALASAPTRRFSSVEPDVRAAAELLSALPDRKFESVEAKVRSAAALLSAAPERKFRTVSRRVIGRLWLARLYRPAIAAAAAAAAVAAFLLRPDTEAPAEPSAGPQIAAALPALPKTNPAETESWQPASLGLQVLQALENGADPRSETLRTAASWFRSHQAPDGTFAGEEQAHNLALPALAMLKLYETGEFPELFTPIDGAIGAVRSRLSAGEPTSSGEALLASVLARADDDGWPDILSGDLRRSLRRLVAAGDPRLSAVASASSFDEKKSALLAYCEKRI